MAPTNPSDAPIPDRALPGSHPRQEPSALAAHAGICAGGRPKRRSLPQSFQRLSLVVVLSRPPAAHPAAHDLVPKQVVVRKPAMRSSLWTPASHTGFLLRSRAVREPSRHHSRDHSRNHSRDCSRPAAPRARVASARAVSSRRLREKPESCVEQQVPGDATGDLSLECAGTPIPVGPNGDGRTSVPRVLLGDLVRMMFGE
jgi:hypothetical protein